MQPSSSSSVAVRPTEGSALVPAIESSISSGGDRFGAQLAQPVDRPPVWLSVCRLAIMRRQLWSFNHGYPPWLGPFEGPWRYPTAEPTLRHASVGYPVGSVGRSRLGAPGAWLPTFSGIVDNSDSASHPCSYTCVTFSTVPTCGTVGQALISARLEQQSRNTGFMGSQTAAVPTVACRGSAYGSLPHDDPPRPAGLIRAASPQQPEVLCDKPVAHAQSPKRLRGLANPAENTPRKHAEWDTRWALAL